MSRKITESARRRLEFIQEFAHISHHGLVIEKLFSEKDIEWFSTHGEWSVYKNIRTTNNIQWVGRNLWRFFGRNITLQYFHQVGVVADISEEEFDELKKSELENFKI